MIHITGDTHGEQARIAAIEARPLSGNIRLLWFDVCSL